MADSITSPSYVLGPFKVAHPFLLAPMAGITNSPFRRLMRRHQSSVVVSELVSATGIEYAGQRTLDLLKFHEEERHVGMQIFGEEIEHLVKACRYIENLGVDFVDLNLGCPVPKVVKKGAGSALCRDPINLGKILKAMVDSVKIPVTIKIRTGWDQTSRNAHEVIQAASDAGVTWVAVHGRTRAQGYSGEADWDFIGELKVRSRIPVIGNGDVLNATQAVSRFKTYGLDGIMIGRAALKNPFIFEQSFALWEGRSMPVLTCDDYVGLLKEQKQLFEETFSPPLAFLHAKKFLAWYSAGYPGSSEFRKRIFSGTESQQLWDDAVQFFLKVLSERSGRNLNELSEPFLMGGHG